MKFTRPNATQVFSYFLFLLSGFILVAAFLLTMNVSVLKNWTLTVDSPKIHVGDTVVLKSEYTKLRDVTGKSSRYIECQNKDKVYIRYALNDAVANRQKGKSGTGIVVIVPPMPNTPTTCRFSISIVYDVYPWRKVNEANSTKPFTLYPKEEAGVVLVQTPTSLVQAPIQAQGPTPKGSVITSSSHNSTPTQAAQPNNVQPTSEATPEPSVTQRIINFVTAIL